MIIIVIEKKMFLKFRVIKIIKVYSYYTKKKIKKKINDIEKFFNNY